MTRYLGIAASIAILSGVCFSTYTHAADAQGQYQGIAHSMRYSLLVGGQHIVVSNVTSDLPNIEECKAFMYQDIADIPMDKREEHYQQYKGKTVKLGNVRFFTGSPSDKLCLFDTLSIIE